MLSSATESTELKQLQFKNSLQGVPPPIITSKGKTVLPAVLSTGCWMTVLDCFTGRLVRMRTLKSGALMIRALESLAVRVGEIGAYQLYCYNLLL